MLNCYRLSRELKIDIDIVKSWSLDKIYGWLAFFIAEGKEFQEQVHEENMTKEERTARFLQQLGSGAKKR